MSSEPEQHTTNSERASPDGGRQGRRPRASPIRHPDKVMRIGAMSSALLDEVRRAPLDESGRDRLAEIHDASVKELAEILPEDLRKELEGLGSPIQDGPPSEAELRVAQAQLVGWLEGLFHGVQASLAAQQIQNRSRLQELHRRGLPAESEQPSHHGHYL